MFATGGDKVNEMRRVLQYITVNTNREMVHKDKWLQLICLFAEEAKTFLGIPVINCRRAEETLRLCFTEVTERENAEKRVSEGTFMIRPSKEYWRFGCFELTWKTGGIAQHSLFAHHVPGDPVLTTLGVLGTPHFTFCRNVDKTQSVSQGTIETARERPKDKLLNQRFYYFVQTDAELAPDTIEYTSLPRFVGREDSSHWKKQASLHMSENKTSHITHHFSNKHRFYTSASKSVG